MSSEGGNSLHEVNIIYFGSSSIADNFVICLLFFLMSFCDAMLCKWLSISHLSYIARS